MKTYLVVAKAHFTERFVKELCNLVLNFSRAAEPPHLYNRVMWNFTAFIEKF